MFRELNLRTKVYLILLSIVTLLLIALTVKKYVNSMSPNMLDVIFFLVLSVVTESLLVSTDRIAISTGFTITISSILLFNPLIACLVVLTGMGFRVWKGKNGVYHIFNTPWYKTLFNVCGLIISVIVSSTVYEMLGGKFVNFNLNEMFIQIFLLAIIYLLVNYFILSLLLYFWGGSKFFSTFIENIRMGLLNVICMVPLGIIIAEVFNAYSYIGVIVIFGPILLARYSFVLYLSMKKSYVDTVKALSLAIEAKDRYTEGHSNRVVNYVEMIAKKMKFSESHLENLRIASLLHDIGKIGIPESILNKPGKLSDEEYSTIKEHPIIGANIVKDVDALKKCTDIIKYHHERYDGNGYPEGLKGDKIPLDAYIIALADAFDAMCSDRPYRKAMSREQASNIIKAERGRQFNPDVADIFLKIIAAEGDL